MGFAETWISAKKTFADATQKKKPPKSFLGIFKQKTGIKKACEQLDDAVAAKDARAGKKAVQTFSKAAKEYKETLLKAMKANDLDYDSELLKLAKSLQKIKEEATSAVEGLNGGPEQKDQQTAFSFPALDSDDLPGTWDKMYRIALTKTILDVRELVGGETWGKHLAAFIELANRAEKLRGKIEKATNARKSPNPSDIEAYRDLQAEARTKLKKYAPIGKALWDTLARWHNTYDKDPLLAKFVTSFSTLGNWCLGLVSSRNTVFLELELPEVERPRAERESPQEVANVYD